MEYIKQFRNYIPSLFQKCFSFSSAWQKLSQAIKTRSISAARLAMAGTGSGFPNGEEKARRLGSRSRALSPLRSYR